MLIKSVNIEVTSACNGKCELCQRHVLSHMPIIHLDIEKLKSLDWHNTDMEYVVLCGSFGDPIFHPQIFEIIDFCHEMNFRISFHTNGSSFNEDWWKRLGTKCKRQDEYWFGIDGLDIETHRKYRGTSLSEVIRNIKAFVSTGGNANMVFIVFRHNEHQIGQIKDFADELKINKTIIRKSRRYNDNLQPPSKYDITKTTPKPDCFAERGELSIGLDGKIHLCCQIYIKYLMKQMLGDKAPEWLKTIPATDSFEEMKNSLYVKYIREMSVCKPCTVPRSFYRRNL